MAHRIDTRYETKPSNSRILGVSLILFAIVLLALVVIFPTGRLPQ